MIYARLFWSFFQIGLFSIGGGYAAMPLIREQTVRINGWLTLAEFTDLVTISEMTPGPIAINAATFVGTRVAGLPGAVIATVGCIVPSCLIATVLALVYSRFQGAPAVQGALGGLRPAVVALVASAGAALVIAALWGDGAVLLNVRSINPVSLAFFAGALFALRRFKLNPVFIILACGLLGVAAHFFT